MKDTKTMVCDECRVELNYTDSSLSTEIHQVDIKELEPKSENDDNAKSKPELEPKSENDDNAKPKTDCDYSFLHFAPTEDDFLVVNAKPKPDCEYSFLHVAPAEDEFLIVSNTNEVIKPESPKPIQAWMNQVLIDPNEVQKPVCNVCLENLDLLLDQESDTTMKEITETRLYIGHNEIINLSNDNAKLKCELERLTAEEHDLVLQIRACNDEISKIAKSISFQQQTENDKLLRMERKSLYWDEQTRAVNEDTSRLKNASLALDTRLRHLESNCMFESAFHIHTETPIGNINGFNLGLDFTVNNTGSWNETNCAWGQVLLLLKAMCHYNGIILKDYELIPYGARSAIEVIRKQHSSHLDKEICRFQLFCQSFGTPNLDFERALRALLNSIGQIETHMLATYPNLELPNTIHPNGISNNETDTFYWITSSNDVTNWTKGLKCMLVNINVMFKFMNKMRKQI